ncbi:MAG: DUF11 domain-containing protein [Sedimentisphaerales bacterium]|nr:DUF11 domain-containing protein [Sedimentisphaerales bacterium]
MKKVRTISILFLAMLLAGCSSQDSAKSQGGADGTSYFWNQDLRPVISVTPAAEQQPAAEASKEPTQKAEPTDKAAAPVPKADLMTASVEELQPIVHDAAAASSTRPIGLGASLVPVDETGGHAFSMVYPRPDYGIIQIDKMMPPEVRLSEPFTYVIKVTNLTEMMLTSIVLSEMLSREFTFKSSEPTASSAEGNKLTWDIDSLGPRASKNIRISGVATDARRLEHCTSVTHTVRDCAVVDVVQPTLELRVTAPTEALLCEPIPLEFVVTNTGTGAAQNVQIADVLPAGLQTTEGKDRIALDAGTLVAGESRRFSVKLRATRVGAFANKATAASVTGLKADSQQTTINVRQPVLAVTKSGPQRQYLGRSVSYEITVLNKGDGPARDTIVEDIVPPNVTSIEATAGAQFSASKLIWELGTLEPNTSKKVRVSYTPTKEGEVVATASASAYCADTVSDSTRTIVTGIATSRLDLIDLEDPVEVGATTTYVVTVTNEGSAADRNVRIACILDEKLQYVSSAGATAGSLMGRTVSFAPLHTLEPKAKATWRVVVKGVRQGDVLFKTTMYTGELALPVEATEVTRIYQQFTDRR